nr:ribosome-recycling factor, mitochondrial [Anolis sagrei ordinatus]
MSGPLRCLRLLPLLLRGRSVLGPPGLPPFGPCLHCAPKGLPPLQARHLATKKAKGGQDKWKLSAAAASDANRLQMAGQERGNCHQINPFGDCHQDVEEALEASDLLNCCCCGSAVSECFPPFLEITVVLLIPGALDHIMVSTKDGKFPLNQLGQVSLKSPQLILVNMSNFPESTAAAVKAIRESGMGLNPEADGTLLRIPVPKVTREHRESLAAVAKQLTNKAKDSLRKVRAAAVSRTKKAKGTVSEDTVRLIEKQVQQMTDDAVAEMEKLLASKTKELLG